MAHAGYDAAEFERWEHVIAMIRLLTLVVLALGLGGFLLSLTDRMLERRTELLSRDLERFALVAQSHLDGQWIARLAQVVAEDAVQDG